MERDLEQLDWRAKARPWVPPQLVRGPRWPRAQPCRGFHSALAPRSPRFGLMPPDCCVHGQGAYPPSLSFLISRIGTRKALPSTRACCEREGGCENAEEAVGRRPHIRHTHSFLGVRSAGAAQSLGPVCFIYILYIILIFLILP